MQGEGCSEADNQVGAVRGREESGTGGQLSRAPIPSTQPDTRGGVSTGVMALVSQLSVQRLDFYARKQNARLCHRLGICLSVRLSVCHTRDLYQNGAS